MLRVHRLFVLFVSISLLHALAHFELAQSVDVMTNQKDRIDPIICMAEMGNKKVEVSDEHRQARSSNLKLLGVLGPPELPYFTTDVWGHKGYAYVGSLGFRSGPLCPNFGVRIIDLSTPTSPALVGTIAQISGSSTAEVEAQRIDTFYFHGDLLVTGVQAM